MWRSVFIRKEDDSMYEDGMTGQGYGSEESDVEMVREQDNYAATGNVNFQMVGNPYTSGVGSEAAEERKQEASQQYTQGATRNRYNMDHIPEEPKRKKEKSGGFGKKVFAAVFCGLLFGLFAGTGIYAVNLLTNELGAKNSVNEAAEKVDESAGESIPATESVLPLPEMNVLQESSEAMAPVMDASAVVESCMPSIVAITNKYTYTQTYSYFFGPSQRVQGQAEASGSGIIVGENDDELLIVTNQHVIEDADELSVQFVDGESYDAAIKGAQSTEDLAIIAVKLSDMSEATRKAIKIAILGDSDALRVGEPAIAIGNSLGYGQSVTLGIISAKDRDFEEKEKGIERKVIQTDAAINPGNSGGALLNIRGEVIGINEAKYSDTAVEGVGYAIPISSAKPIIDELATKTTRSMVAEGEAGYLGVGGVDVTEDVAERYGMPRGVYISTVGEGTAAETAGIQKGDIITEFDGESVTSMEGLRKVVSYYAAGSTVEVKFQRTGSNGFEEMTVSVVLGKRPKE